MKRRKTPKKDKLRQPGEHWYELTDLWNPDKKLKGLGNGMHIVGRLDEVVIVEVPADATQHAVQDLQRKIKATGIKSVVFCVQEGIRFLKLKAVPFEQESVLDKDLAEMEKKQHEPNPESHADSPGD